MRVISKVCDWFNEKPRGLLYLEVLGLFFVLGSVALFLLANYSLKAWSDPAAWYNAGKEFFSLYPDVKLTRGYAFLIAIAMKTAGPSRSFLLNLPIVVLWVACIYLLGKKALSIGGNQSERALSMVCGAVAVLLFLVLNREMMLVLSSPYRDPPAFVLSALSCWFLVCFMEHEKRSLWYVSGSAVSLGFACCMRETSVLLLLPLVLYAVVEKIKDKRMSFWIPVLVFMMSFVAACLPAIYLYAHLYIESVDVNNSASVGSNVMNTVSAAPGLKSASMTRVLPSVLRYLSGHYGKVVLLFIVVGVIRGIKRRSSVVLCLLLSSCAIYILFYGHYTTVAARYLVIVDLFAIPLAALGIVTIIQLVFNCFSETVSRRVCPLIVLLLFIASAVVIHFGNESDHRRFLVSDARKLGSDLGQLFDDNALLLADRPLAEIIGCFVDIDSVVLWQYGKRNRLVGYELPKSVRTKINAEKRKVYFSSGGEDAERFILRSHDLRLVKTYDTSDYGLNDVLRNRHINLYEVETWSTNQVTRIVSSQSTGLQIIKLNLRQMSTVDRKYVKVYLGDVLLDADPMDDMNYYSSFFTKDVPVEVSVVSDAPVPCDIGVELQPPRETIWLQFREHHVYKHIGRLSKSFLTGPGVFPSVFDSAEVVVPTVSPKGSMFVFMIRMGMETPTDTISCNYELLLNEVKMKEGTLSQKDKRGGSWEMISFAASEDVVKANNSRLTLRMTDVEPSQRLKMIVVDMIGVSRFSLSEGYDIVFGAGSDEFALAGGLYHSEKMPAPNNATWRWTDGHAKIRLPMVKTTKPINIRVGYFLANMPESRLAPDAKFVFNGRKLSGTVSEDTFSGMRYKVVSLTVESDDIKQGENILEVVTEPWVPAENDMGRDKRKLGVMLRNVCVEVGQSDS